MVNGITSWLSQSLSLLSLIFGLLGSLTAIFGTAYNHQLDTCMYVHGSSIHATIYNIAILLALSNIVAWNHVNMWLTTTTTTNGRRKKKNTLSIFQMSLLIVWLAKLFWLMLPTSAWWIWTLDTNWVFDYQNCTGFVEANVCTFGKCHTEDHPSLC